MIHPCATEDDLRRATRIRVLRAKLRVTQVEVAVASGLPHRTQLAMYESAQRLMSEDTFQRILTALAGFEGRSPASSKTRVVRHGGFR